VPKAASRPLARRSCRTLDPMPATERMSEAEVSLRLAHHLVVADLARASVHVALDGAQVSLRGIQHFDVPAFLASLGWRAEVADHWRATYARQGTGTTLVVHSRPGCGDVACELEAGGSLVVEAKKGTLANCNASSEYRLLREALGQLLTLETVPEHATLAVAVPCSPRFASLARRWRKAPLVRQSGICILTVARTGEVEGLEHVV